MRRLSLCFALSVAALVTAPTVLADGGPILATQGGVGVVAHRSIQVFLFFGFSTFMLVLNATHFVRTGKYVSELERRLDL